MLDRTEFYQAHLDRVSRSFAFCIAQLPSPLREWVGLSYLLCRVVDTIEDARWASAEAQTRAFTCFDMAVLAPDGLGQIETVLTLIPSDIPDEERLLLGDARRLFQDLHALPTDVRGVVSPLIHSMSLGMQHFARRKPMVLNALDELNQYCFFVAGVVGELLANVFRIAEPGFVPGVSGLLRAHHFGQFLQKVNVLKDQVGDEREGRYLVPSRVAVEASAEVNGREAFRFLLSVPARAPEFRRFCAWSLMIGLEALRVARDSREVGRVLSVPRERTLTLLGEIEVVLSDDAGLTTLFERLCAPLGWREDASASASADVVPTWFRASYHGALSDEALRHLGL